MDDYDQNSCLENKDVNVIRDAPCSDEESPLPEGSIYDFSSDFSDSDDNYVPNSDSEDDENYNDPNLRFKGLNNFQRKRTFEYNKSEESNEEVNSEKDHEEIRSEDHEEVNSAEDHEEGLNNFQRKRTLECNKSEESNEEVNSEKDREEIRSEDHEEVNSAEDHEEFQSSKNCNIPPIYVDKHKFNLGTCGDDDVNVEVSRRHIQIRDKKTLCCFCIKEIGDSNFARHLENKHADTDDVQKLLQLPKKSKERSLLISIIRKRGNLVLMEQGILRPVKRTKKESHEKAKKSYVNCVFCSGLFVKKYLYRHVRTCALNPDSKSTILKNRALAKGYSLVASEIMKTYKFQSDSLKQKVLENMSGDEVCRIITNDPLILAMGERFLNKTKFDHLSVTVANKMRELGRIMVVIKEKSKYTQLFDVLKPENYSLLVLATRTIARYDPETRNFGAPSLALHMGTNLKLVTELALHMVKIKHPNFMHKKNIASLKEDFKELIDLIQTSWRFDVSSAALENLNTNCYEKNKQLPIPDDIDKFKNHINETLSESVTTLKSNPNDATAYRDLVESTYGATLLLNRRRIGELQRTTVATYINAPDFCESDCHATLTENEKLLLKTIKRIQVRGKRNRPVPVLFLPVLQHAVDLILKLRSNFIPENNPYLFPAMGNLKPVGGWKVIERFRAGCGAKFPNRLTSTNLRKHVATNSQILELTQSDRRQLSDFMGHTAQTHDQFYRLPQEVFQGSKIVKLLLLMSSGTTKKHVGKTLDEIEINIDEEYANLTDDDNEEDVDDPQVVDNPQLVDNENQPPNIDSILDDNCDTSPHSTTKKHKNQKSASKNLSDANESDQDEVSIKKRKKRKTVKSSSIVDDSNELSSEDDSEDNIPLSKFKKVSPNYKTVKPRGKWSSKQKNIVLKYFSKHIKKRQAPKKFECEELKLKHQILQEKSWVQIKTLVFNEYVKTR